MRAIDFEVSRYPATVHLGRINNVPSVKITWPECDNPSAFRDPKLQYSCIYQAYLGRGFLYYIRNELSIET
jgi:hypothetical protein